jgi:hypothetical protein
VLGEMCGKVSFGPLIAEKRTFWLTNIYIRIFGLRLPNIGKLLVVKNENNTLWDCTGLPPYDYDNPFPYKHNGT